MPIETVGGRPYKRVILYDLNGNAVLFPAEDTVHISGDRGIMALGVRKDVAAALAGTDGDYIPLIVDANGRLHTIFGNSPVAYDSVNDLWKMRPWSCLSTGALTASAAIRTEAAWIFGYIIVDGGSGDVTLSLRDGGSGGTVLWADRTIVANTHVRFMFPVPMEFANVNGPYATIGGTSPTVYVLYRDQA